MAFEWIGMIVEGIKETYDKHKGYLDAADPDNAVPLEQQIADQEDTLDSLKDQLEQRTKQKTGSQPYHTPRSKYAKYGLTETPSASQWL